MSDIIYKVSYKHLHKFFNDAWDDFDNNDKTKFTSDINLLMDNILNLRELDLSDKLQKQR